ncbi:MAG: hypothetical protein H8D97_01555 [Proteobacteria bacterium]|nr:hypothetical protein [Pseudomonadota bacterium]
MRIHNLLGDNLLELGRFINNKVLHGRPIDHFQYNIGDSSFQLDYDKGYKLPAAIINLLDIQPYQNKPYVFQHRSGNIHRIPVLYNHNKDIFLHIQEEEFNLNATFIINCMNHNQALDIQHQLLSYLPIGKYMHFYEFTCFLEVDDFLINDYFFDPNKDEIKNLFLKQNRFTDSIDYSFSLRINPLLRFNNITVQLGEDTNRSTFAVTMDIEYLVTIPVYILYPNIDPQLELKLGDDFVPIVRENVDISVGETLDYLRIKLSSVEPNDNFNIILEEPLFTNEYDQDSLEFSQPIDFKGKQNEIIKGTLKGKVLGEITDFDFESIIDNSILIGSGQLFNNYEEKENNITGKIEGYEIEGKLEGVKCIADVRNSDSIIGWFSGNIKGKYIEKEIFVQTTPKYKYKNLSNIRVIFKNSQYILRGYDNFYSKNIYRSLTNINNTKTFIVAQDSNIIGITIRNKSTKEKVRLDFNEPIQLSTNGQFYKVFNIQDIDTNNIYQEYHLNNFLFKIPYGVVLYDFLPEGNYRLVGNINLESGEIEELRFEDMDNSEIELDYILDKLHFNKINFKFKPNYGHHSNIERFHMDLSWVEGVISSDEGMPLEDSNFGRYSKTIILAELLYLEELDNRDFQFNISIKGIPHISDDISNLIWKFKLQGSIITFSEREDMFLDRDLSTTERLYFRLPREFYFKYCHNKVNKAQPVFLSLGQPKK